MRAGDFLEVSSPRGSFILRSGDGPVVLLSAGIGATPVLAMLYAMSWARSTRPVLWLHAASDGKHLPFAAEVRRLVSDLAHGRSYVCFAVPPPPTGSERTLTPRAVSRGRCSTKSALRRTLTSTYAGQAASWRT